MKKDSLKKLRLKNTIKIFQKIIYYIQLQMISFIPEHQLAKYNLMLMGIHPK